MYHYFCVLSLSLRFSLALVSRTGRLYFIFSHFPWRFFFYFIFWCFFFLRSSEKRRSVVTDYRADVRRCRLCRSFSAIGGMTSIVLSRGSWTSTSAPASTGTIWSQISPVSASIGHPYARSTGIGTIDHGGTWRVKTRAGPARFSWTMTISRLVFLDRFCSIE